MTHALKLAILAAIWSLIVITAMLIFGLWAQTTGAFNAEGTTAWFVCMWPLAAGIIALPIFVYGCN